MSIVTGGKFYQTVHGKKYTIDGISMTGGEWDMGAGDTLVIRNLNLYGTHDLSISGGLVLWSGTAQRPVVIRTNPSSGNASCMFSGASWTHNMTYVKFVNMSDPSGSIAVGGVNFSSRTTPANSSLANLIFDTATVALNGCVGLKISDATVYSHTGQDAGMTIYNGSYDSLVHCLVTVNGQHGIYAQGADGTYLYGDTLLDLTMPQGAYGIYMTGLSGTTVKKNKVISCRTQGFYQGLALGAMGSGRVFCDSSTVDNSTFISGANTHINVSVCGTGDTIMRSVIAGSTTRGSLVFYDNAYSNGLRLLYNDFIGNSPGYGWGKAPISFDCTNGSGCGYTINNLEMVGNAIYGYNSGFGYSDIWLSGDITVNVTKFLNNALDKIDTTSVNGGTNRHFNVPVGSWPGTNKVTSAFGFIDSAAGDWRLRSDAPILNCGDSANAVGVYGMTQASKAMFDIGYYQSYTTGTCGGAPSTPTGACCYNYTCAVMTEAQCTALSGVYQGDGTSTCSNCTEPPTETGTFPHFSWVRTAAITYGLTDSIASKFLGRVGTDLVLNMSNTAYGNRSGNWDNYHAMNPYGKNLNYLTASSYRSGVDLAELTTYCGLQGQSVVNDSFFIKVNTGTIGLYDVQSQGAPCAVGHITYTSTGNYLEFCGWTTSGRLEWDYTKQMARDFQVWRATKYMSGVYTASDGTKYAGVIEDENTTYKAAAYSEPPGNSMAFPHGSGTWVGGTSGAAQCGPWTGYTYSQILDSLTKLKQNDWLKRIGDTARKYTGFWFANSVTYGAVGSDKVPGDIVKTNTGVWPMENALFCLEASGQGNPATWNNATWAIMDTIYVRDTGSAIVWCNVNRLDTVALVAAGGASPTGTARAKLQRLCYYYMAHHPDRTYFMLTSNSTEHTANDYKKTDTLYKFTKAIYHNIGRPTGLRSVVQTGTDGAGQSYTLYRRNFQYGTVIYRADNGTNRTDASAVTYNLGGDYYPAYEDSTRGGLTSTTTIRNCEGKIFLSVSSTPTGSISIDDASVTEGGTATFTVTLSAAQSVLTTFNYSTANGTALSGTDYTATSGSKSIPIGSTSTTITVPTTNRASCQTIRAFTVSITNVSPTTITIIDPTGTGTIIDDDCGTTYGKTYKGKIVIKGKVKP